MELNLHLNLDAPSIDLHNDIVKRYHTLEYYYDNLRMLMPLIEWYFKQYKPKFLGSYWTKSKADTKFVIYEEYYDIAYICDAFRSRYVPGYDHESRTLRRAYTISCYDSSGKFVDKNSYFTYLNSPLRVARYMGGFIEKWLSAL